MEGTNFQSPVNSTLTSEFINGDGLITKGFCTGVPPTTASVFAHGALLTRTDSGTGNKAVYENVGSSAVPSWNLIGDVTAGEITLATNNLLQGSSTGVAEAVTNITLPKEGARTISIAASTTTNTAGAQLTIAAAAGVGSGAGGALGLVGGAPGVSGSAQGVTIYGQDGGATAGNGGPVQIYGGNATANNDDGGDISLTGGESHGTGQPGRILLNAEVLVQQDTPTAKTISATLTAAEIAVGIITVNQGGGAPSALQLPTGTALDALFISAQTDNAFDFSVINTSIVDAEDASITVNTGVTIVGSADIPAYSAAGSLNSSARFRLRRTGTATWVCYRIS